MTETYKDYWEKAFAEGLKREREKQGLTQDYLADEMSKLGFSFHQATVYKIEIGDRKVSIGEAHGLAELLSLEIDDLLDNQDDSEQALGRRLHTNADNMISAMLVFIDQAQRLRDIREALGVAVQAYDNRGYFYSPTLDATPVRAADYFYPLLAFNLHEEVLHRIGNEIWRGELSKVTSSIHGTGGFVDQRFARIAGLNTDG